MHTLNLLLLDLEFTVTAYVSYKSRLLAAPRRLIEEIDTLREPPPRCPIGKYKFHIRVRNPRVQQSLSSYNNPLAVKVGASPVMKIEGDKLVPVCSTANNSSCSRINKRLSNINPIGSPKLGTIQKIVKPPPIVVNRILPEATPPKVPKLTDNKFDHSTINKSGANGASGGGGKGSFKDATANIVSALAKQVKTNRLQLAKEIKKTESKPPLNRLANIIESTDGSGLAVTNEIRQKRREQRHNRLKLMAHVNKRRVDAIPIYGSDCRASLEQCLQACQSQQFCNWKNVGYTNCCRAATHESDQLVLNRLITSYERRCHNLKRIFDNFVIYVPSACAPRLRFYVRNLTSSSLLKREEIETTIQREMSPKLVLLHPIISAMTTQFPDPRLIQYDCGKLQTLDSLLRKLKAEHHRVLIFTQMTKMLDILEAFLNYHGHIYLRLDGATKVEQRQILMERFNSDQRIFSFILSTRSGGVGINLTGADTVIFYDSDWNPTMDAQAQDRCHRIGQTRDVHIYRLVSEKTIEVNILKKANQKRMLSDMAIEGGNFTTTFFKSSTIKDLFNDDSAQQNDVLAVSNSSNQQMQEENIVCDNENSQVDMEKQSLKAYENALAAAEDEQDVQAAKSAKAEAAADLAEFDENIPLDDIINEAGAAAATVELSKADIEMQNLVKQVREKYFHDCLLYISLFNQGF